MSETTDGAREVEDFFNEEVLGIRPTAEEPPFLPDGPPEPESKSVEEAAAVIEEQEQEGTSEGTEEAEVSAEEASEQEEVELEEGTSEEPPEPSEDELIGAWARKKYGDDVGLETESERKFAKALYEQEKLLGRKAEETRVLQEEAQQRELQERIDALNTPGVLTTEEDQWVDEAIGSDDPAEWAYGALQGERPDLYAAILDRWSSLGEKESRQARIFHSRVLQAVTSPQPDPQESYTAALGHTFLSLGLNIERDGPVILAKAEELGGNHPAVQGMMSPNDDIRLLATRSVYDLVSASKTTVSKARTDDVVNGRVQEEELRRQAAGVTQGGPRIEQPKKSPFWDQFEQEIEDRGWDGNRPTYGRGEE
jgi:hypothetical protein